MTTLNSSSAAESTMEEPTNHHQSLTSEDESQEVDAQVWAAFSNNFQQVQSVLDRNRTLIQQVNENHQSKIADNMVRNVALIQEINDNINKVRTLYSDFSSDFCTMYHQRNKDGDGGEKAWPFCHLFVFCWTALSVYLSAFE